MCFFVLIVRVKSFRPKNKTALIPSFILLLINKLKSGNNNAIEWFKMNKMIVKLDKFQVIGLNKKRFDLPNTNLQVGNQVIKSVLSVELLGI